MVDIEIDSRETKASWFSARLIESGINPKITILSAGDFLIFGKTEKDAILIERKTASDFLSSVEGKKIAPGHWEKGRIWDQLKRMKETGIADRWVLIEGNPFNRRLTSYRKKGFSKQRIWGALRGIAKWGTKVEHTKNMDETVEYLIYLVGKQKRPKKEFALRTSPPNTMSLKDKRIYLLEGLPGVGPKTAKKILKEGSLRKFFSNPNKSTAIGAKIKKEIGKILR